MFEDGNVSAEKDEDQPQNWESCFSNEIIVKNVNTHINYEKD